MEPGPRQAQGQHCHLSTYFATCRNYAPGDAVLEAVENEARDARGGVGGPEPGAAVGMETAQGKGPATYIRWQT